MWGHLSSKKKPQLENPLAILIMKTKVQQGNWSLRPSYQTPLSLLHTAAYITGVTCVVVTPKDNVSIYRTPLQECIWDE